MGAPPRSVSRRPGVLLVGGATAAVASVGSSTQQSGRGPAIKLVVTNPEAW